ncbi:MAG: MetQ/NlpA family ABC transporter substrate-binding protein [Erysipelotrichaceae bacterium]|nr:MetQ/NlpA family ABC transporter substrate-binding protein [Erysipelotrichaceae bacterium]
MKKAVRTIAAAALAIALAGCSSSTARSGSTASSSSSDTIKSLSDIRDGASIGVPNDADNLDRALRLLVNKGLLKDPGTDDYVTETTFNGNDKLNPHKYEIVPVEAAQVARSLEDYDIAVVNGNYALEAGLPDKHPAIEIEDFDTQGKINRTNFIVVEQDKLDSEKTKALVAAVTDQKVEDYINDNYKGSVIPSFIDENGNEVKSEGVKAPSDKSDNTITVGATEVPHAEILNNVVAGILEDAGWKLDVQTFTDYVTPNTALEEGSLDANYFQTLTYMNDQNDSNGLHLAAAVGVHIEPMGIYTAKDGN